MWYSITLGLLEHFYFFSKMGSKGLSRGVNPKKLIFKMFQTTSCGYSKLVSQGAWYNAKGINLIRASSAEKTPKMFLNIDIYSSTDKWAISDHFFDVFSGQDDWIELNPFANLASAPISGHFPIIWPTNNPVPTKFVGTFNFVKSCPRSGLKACGGWVSVQIDISVQPPKLNKST